MFSPKDIGCHHMYLAQKNDAKREAAGRPGLLVPGKRLDHQCSHDGLDQGCVELKTRLPSQLEWDVCIRYI